MTPKETEDALDLLASWTDEAADVMNRLSDRITALEIKIADLHSRIDEWDLSQ